MNRRCTGSAHLPAQHLHARMPLQLSPSQIICRGQGAPCLIAYFHARPAAPLAAASEDSRQWTYTALRGGKQKMRLFLHYVNTIENET